MTEMFFSNGVQSFCNDGFEGSNEEYQIFREVFFGKHIGNDGGRSPATSISEYTLSKNTSICSNTNSSLLISQSSPKVFCLQESDYMNNVAPVNSASRYFSENISVQEVNDSNAYLEQRNLSVEKICNTVIDENFTSSSPISCESIAGMSFPCADSFLHTVSFPLIESFDQGVAWNYYLLKQNVPWEKGVDVGIADLLNCRFLGSSGDHGKDVHASKAITLPVSTETYATRLWVESPSSCAAHQLEYHAHADERTMDYNNQGLHLSDIVESDVSKDPRRLLLSYALNLLKDAGWLVTKHKRPCRNYFESKYRSPAGRSYREFSKVWKACKEILLGDRFLLIEQDDVKGWNNISLFFSDLYDTLMSMKREHNQSDVSGSLIQQWNILNPFITIIFIDKKIGMLRKGEVVEARPTLLIDKHEKRTVVLGLRHVNEKEKRRHTPTESKVRISYGKDEKRDTVLGLKCGDLKANLVFGGQIPGLFSDGHRHSDSEITAFGSKKYSFTRQSHDDYFSQCNWRGTQETTRLLSETPFYTPAINNNCLTETAGGIQGSAGPWDKNDDRNTSVMLDAQSNGNNTLVTLDTESNVNALPGLFKGDTANVFPGFSSDNLLLSSASAYSFPDDASFLPNNTENVERGGQLKENLQIVACKNTEELLDDQRTDSVSHLMASQSSFLDCHYSSFSTGCRSHKSLPQTVDRVNSENKYESHTELVLQQDGPELPVLRITDIIEQPNSSGKENHHCSMVDLALKKKTRRKSKKISDIKSTELLDTQIIGKTSSVAELLDVDICASHLELEQMRESPAAEVRNEGSCEIFFSSSKHQVEKKRLKNKKAIRDCSNIDKRKRSRKCEIDDDDLLVSAIIKNKDIGQSPGRSKSKMKEYKSRSKRMRKSKNRGCRLLPHQVGKGRKLSAEEKWSVVGARSVLSWLISSGVISYDDVFQYRDPNNNTVVKEGRVTMNGIICNCCKEVMSVTQFKIHAGFMLNRPCLNLFMGSGESLTLCELQAWSSEYKTRKRRRLTNQTGDKDQNDDSCGVCGDGGELICCDNCPSTFHQACLLTEDLPDGNWYCTNCTCQICGDLVSGLSSDGWKCSQCEHKCNTSVLHLMLLDGLIMTGLSFMSVCVEYDINL
ncbi:hypothetical protein SAY86_016480 [Trapa natans]|uniref:PHD-type domain-containing protein n=1 Tax=Trapa natans TaxID=22666 RepID=A0AAN7LG40_TRANT|nr:hypothetical protein SAY86_016480 [Trapa natans]